MVSGTNLAFKDGDGEEPPSVKCLALTDEEIIFLHSVLYDGIYDDSEAFSIFNRLQVLLDIPPVKLVVDNTVKKQ